MRMPQRRFLECMEQQVTIRSPTPARPVVQFAEISGQRAEYAQFAFAERCNGDDRFAFQIFRHDFRTFFQNQSVVVKLESRLKLHAPAVFQRGISKLTVFERFIGKHFRIILVCGIQNIVDDYNAFARLHGTPQQN